MPLLQREGGKEYMCVWGGRIGLVLTYDKLVPRAMTAAHRTITPLPDLKSGGEKDVPVAG